MCVHEHLEAGCKQSIIRYNSHTSMDYFCCVQCPDGRNSVEVHVTPENSALVSPWSARERQELCDLQCTKDQLQGDLPPKEVCHRCPREITLATCKGCGLKACQVQCMYTCVGCRKQYCADCIWLHMHDDCHDAEEIHRQLDYQGFMDKKSVREDFLVFN